MSIFRQSTGVHLVVCFRVPPYAHKMPCGIIATQNKVKCGKKVVFVHLPLFGYTALILPICYCVCVHFGVVTSVKSFVVTGRLRFFLLGLATFFRRIFSRRQGRGEPKMKKKAIEPSSLYLVTFPINQYFGLKFEYIFKGLL